jgi:AraC family transcriptional regulator of adaptative response / DNA-3-methyladenine glycosylase II
MESPAALPPPEVCERARLSRDARFDGLFFTAVSSTGIYCRPVCPAPTPKRANVKYFGNAAAAEAAGFRPCLRCRPELSPGDGAWRRGDAAVARALKLIDDGLLAEQPLSALAERVHLGERQLRRLFVERLGAPPIGVHGTRRLLFAKQLLTETSLPITDVALAAGFGSLRRFNTTFRDAYRMAPRDLRKRPSAARAEDEGLVLRLGYRPPYDFEAILSFMRGRAMPGIEHVDDASYARAVLADESEGGAVGGPREKAGAAWLRVSEWPGGEHALRLELHGVAPSRLIGIVNRVRRMFDLDADPQAIGAVLSRSPRLAPILAAHPGVRVPSSWDGFEAAVRAIVGQQVSTAAARTIAMRLAQRFGTPLETPVGVGVDVGTGAAHPALTHRFPSPAVLAEADLSGIGLTGSRAETLRTVARALLDGEVDFRPERTLEDFVARWTALRGIGPWTAQYLALRALGHPDAFPAEDLMLQRAFPGEAPRLSAKALVARAEAWRPWRGYAVLLLWRDLMAAPAPKKTKGTSQ